MTTTRTYFTKQVSGARWLLTLLVLSGLVLCPAHAKSVTHAESSTRTGSSDVITFTGGHADENDPTIYVIDVEPENLIAPNEEEYEYSHKARVTFQRPQGATATREASITVMESIGWSDEITVTFAPGETTKTVDLLMQTFQHGESNGNSPVPFVVLRTNHADTDYKMLLLNIQDTMTDDVPQCTYTSQMGILQDLSYNMSNSIYCQRWGNQLVFSIYLQDTYVEVSADSRIVLQTRYADHTGLAADADDYALSKTREVVLTPINVGAVTNQILYVYQPRDDEFLYTSNGDIDNTDPDPDAYRGVLYRIVEAGPFKLANPAEDAIKTFFLSRTDLGDGITYTVNADSKKFVPEFSNVSINKTSFKSGETIVITAKMDNWQVVKRARQSTFMMAFGVSFDNGQTTQPRRFSFDETTGMLTCYATAPTVSESTTVNVDFGPVADAPIYDEYGEYTGYYSDQVVTGSEGMFSVTVSPEPAPAVPATQIDFVEMPADGSDIGLIHIWSNYYEGPKFPLAISCIPADATDAGSVVFTVENLDGAAAEITYTEQGEPTLDMGKYAGTVILTATLPATLPGVSAVSVSRTYNLTRSLFTIKHHTNTYLAGTTFPKFQFELDRLAQLEGGWDDWTQAEPVTVNYTHANGTQWTEQYDFGQLTYHSQYYEGTEIHWVRYYDLPFVFSEEHPNATVDQIGKPLVTAEIIMNMMNKEGHRLKAVSTATLIPQLKELSFSDYYSTTAYYNNAHPVTLSSEVMYLPTKGFTVGYEIPELGLSATYNSQSGDAVPDWLEVQDEGLYSTARITVTPALSESTTHLSLYTLAQSSYDPDAAMQRYLTSSTDLSFIEPEGHMVYRVNGQDVAGDLTFSNIDAVTDIIGTMQSSGFSQDDLFGTLAQTRAFFTIYDDIFDGANVTLTCDGEPIQSMTHYKGCFTFMPPADGHTYKIEVYYPGYGKRYENTFVSHDLRNIYHLFAMGSRRAYKIYNPSGPDWVYVMPVGYTLSYMNNGQTYTTTCDADRNITAYIYADNSSDFYIASGSDRIKVSNPDVFKPLEYNIKPELKQERYALFSYQDALTADDNYQNAFKRLYESDWTSYGSYLFLNWNELYRGNTLVTVVNSQGEPVTNATLNYACVDEEMAIQGSAGTVSYDATVNAYQINTDPSQYAELIEVVADGYQPILTTMYLWNYQYYSPENREKPRRHTIVLHQSGEQLKNLSFEVLERKGNVKDNKMDAERVIIDLLTTDKSDVLNYSETADYETAVKHLDDPKFGEGGWTGTKYVHLTGYMPYQDNLDLKLTNSDGSVTLQPDIHDYNKSEFTTFSQNYCQFDFDLVDKIAANSSLKPLLVDGTQTLAELPELHNHTVDLMALSEANNVSLPCNASDLTNVDNDLSNNGVDMKDMGKAFDKFNFQMPPILPFTVNIERNGDYFLVRAVCERNFIPGGKVMDALNKLDDIKYFDEQYQACMDAVNSAKPMNDDFFNNIPRFPAAFFGIKGFLSGIGHINPETKKLEINFYDGGLTFEASASARANVSFFIGGFGMSVDAKLATTMALVNRAAAQGQVGTLPKIDFVIDNQCRLKICAWAYAGIDIWIAKAAVGVRGGGCVDLQTRTCIPTYGDSHHSGTRTTVQAAMEAYAEVRFLWWKKKKSWRIFDAHKTYLSPNNTGNPLHPDYGEVFSFSRQNVNKSYKKLRKKAIADLGTPIISNVSGMARPTYMLGGTSLLFNNLKTPGDYNDDRLQLFDGSSKTDFVDTGIEAPMYDFAEARYRTTEIVAFEQVNSSIDKDNLEVLDESSQEQSVSENTSIYATINYGDDGEGWRTSCLSQQQQGIACLTPAVAIDRNNTWHCAAIWQQGKVKFNDEGDRYIDGSLMLSRNSGWQGWSEPVEIMRLNQRSVPVDYQVSMKDDEVLVMMTLKQDINNSNKQPTVVFLSVAADNKVRVRYTMMEGSKPQMVSVNGNNLVAFLQQKTDDSDNSSAGRDINISTVNMKGEPTGEVSGSLGLDRQMVNDFRLIADDEAETIDDVALLWTQSDQEGTTDEQTGATSFTIKNSIYTSKLNSYNNSLYLTKPFAIATIPDDVKLVSMDGYLDGLDMKVAFCVANDNEGAAVLEKNVSFEDGFESTVWFNGIKDNALDLEVEVVNTGLSAINAVEIVIANTSTATYNVTLLPGQSMRFPVQYPQELFGYSGRFDVDVHALIQPSASRSAKVRRRLAARPRRISQNTSLTADIPVDMALKILSKHVDADGRTTIVAEVNNASTMPLAEGTSCKVALYAAPLADEAVSNEVTVSYEDLYDADNKQNKVKIVTLTTDAPDFAQTLFLRTTPMKGSTVLTDQRPSNNVLPVSIKGRYRLGDANNDGQVNIADVTAIINRINGASSNTFVEKAANVNKDDGIDIGDVTGVINIINQ